jgi:hypothetical protein
MIARLVRRPPLSLIACLVALLACADHRANQSATIRERDSLTRVQSGAKTRDSSVPFYLDSAEDCGFLRSSTYPDPVALVQRYVEYDHAAAFLESTPIMDSVYACPNHLPGPDEFSVVRGSALEPLSRSDSDATVLVRSEQVGRMSQDSVGFIFIREAQVVVDTFRLVSTPFGWRILSPQLPDRVLDSIVLSRPERFKLRPVVRDSLIRSASRPDT